MENIVLEDVLQEYFLVFGLVPESLAIIKIEVTISLVVFIQVDV